MGKHTETVEMYGVNRNNLERKYKMPIISTSAKSNRINVKNLVYCILNSDSASGVEYGDVIPLAKAMTVDVTPSQATGVLYGDGVQTENIAKLTGLSAALEVNKIAIENRAAIQGHKFENGVMVYAAGDEAPYIALGYMVEGTNGYNEYVWLLKGRVQEGNQKASQANDNINFTTDSMTINFIARDYDSFFEFTGDTANSDFTAEQAADWFKSGPVTYPEAS